MCIHATTVHLTELFHSLALSNFSLFGEFLCTTYRRFKRYEALYYACMLLKLVHFNVSPLVGMFQVYAHVLATPLL